MAKTDKIPKYIWLSSSKRGGPGPGAQIHIPLSKEKSKTRVRLTEGELKADACTALTPVPTLSLPGVTIWKGILPVLKELKVKTVILAIDMDAYTNRDVANALQKIAIGIKSAGHEVEIETWDGAKAKGIDDALLGNVEITCHAGIKTFKVIKEIVTSAVESNPTPEELKTIGARKLVSEALTQIKSSPDIVFQQDVLRALLAVKGCDPGLWQLFRIAVGKSRISLRAFEQALDEEASSEFQESPKSSCFGDEIPCSENSDHRSDPLGDGFSSSAIPKYAVKNGCIILNKPTKDGVTPIQLSNFTAKIETEETVDDGVEPRRSFVVTGILENGRVLPKTSVLADQFNPMNWVTSEWGAGAIPSAGMGTKDHLRAAIQQLSGDVPQQITYAHLGWRKIGDEWYYFFNGGAISENGLAEGFNVDLGEGNLNDFRLPGPPTGESLQSAIRASISILTLAPVHVIYPAFAGIFRAVLGEALPIDFSIFLFGLTGIGKSELAALLQAFFGSGFHDKKRLPGNWTSTANSLELAASTVKDGLFTVDDFSPQPTPLLNNERNQKAERLFRAQGNGSGRGRLTSEIEQRAPRPPRGLIVSTGEDLPPGASLRSRLFIIELVDGDIDFRKLSPLQEHARDGLFAETMSAFIKWIAPNMDILKSDLAKEHHRIRAELSDSAGHKRSPDIAASLILGLRAFLRFAFESGAIDEGAIEQHKANFQQSLVDAGERQKAHQASEDPANRFIELIASAVNAGRAHIADSATDEHPMPNPGRWGWHKEVNSAGDTRYWPRGDRIGWLSVDELWLDPGAAYAIVQKVATDQKTTISISEKTLWKLLDERGLILRSTEPNRFGTKRTVKGAGGPIRRRVLVLPDKNILWEGASAPSDPDGPLPQG